MNRLALYLGDGASRTGVVDLRPYFHGAQMCGLRIVMVKSEARRAKAGARPVLKRLIQRMEAGEFEAIVSVVDDDVEPAALPPPTVHGDKWLRYPAKTRR